MMKKIYFEHFQMVPYYVLRILIRINGNSAAILSSRCHYGNQTSDKYGTNTRIRWMDSWVDLLDKWVV